MVHQIGARQTRLAAVGSDAQDLGDSLAGFSLVVYNISMKVNGSISHDRREETIEAKARWFRSLPMSERMDMLCSFTDLALSVNPALQERKHAQPVAGRIQILSPE